MLALHNDFVKLEMQGMISYRDSITGYEGPVMLSSEISNEIVIKF